MYYIGSKLYRVYSVFLMSTLYYPIFLNTLYSRTLDTYRASTL